MRATRTAAAAGLLAVEAGLAVLSVLFHHSFTATYGDITDLALKGWRSGLSSGIVGPLVLVGAVAVVVFVLSPHLWTRMTAAAIPVLMVVGILVVTPAALQEKLETQYDATPQCLEGMEPDDEAPPSPPAHESVQESQQAFDSIQHVGLFSRGGGSGVGGCDRSFLLMEEVDVVQHYRAALADAGWRVVEDDGQRLRAERDGMAFEVVPCEGGGVVWAGRIDEPGRAQCGHE
jgi:hypothetical protein